MKRKKISYNGAKRLFTATAQKTRKENVKSKPMRGGIRM